jgi:hypothetical protein
MVNLSTLSKRLDRLDDGDAEAYQAAWDKHCDDQGQPRISVAGTASIEELLQLYQAAAVPPARHFRSQHQRQNPVKAGSGLDICRDISQTQHNGTSADP